MPTSDTHFCSFMLQKITIAVHSSSKPVLGLLLALTVIHEPHPSPHAGKKCSSTPKHIYIYIYIDIMLRSLLFAFWFWAFGILLLLLQPPHGGKHTHMCVCVCIYIYILQGTHIDICLAICFLLFGFCFLLFAFCFTPTHTHIHPHSWWYIITSDNQVSCFRPHPMRVTQELRCRWNLESAYNTIWIMASPTSYAWELYHFGSCMFLSCTFLL